MPLRSLEGLEAALRESFSQPVLILKHSCACGVSAQALDEVSDWLRQAPVRALSYLVTVQTSRDIANAITQRLGVRHESPQALIVRDGRVHWHGSHFRVTPTAIAQQLQHVS